MSVSGTEVTIHKPNSNGWGINLAFACCMQAHGPTVVVSGAGLTVVNGTYHYMTPGVWECSNCALACQIKEDPSYQWGINIGCNDPTGTSLGYTGSHGIYGSGSIGFNAGPNGGGCSDNSDPSSCTFGRRSYWPGPIPEMVLITSTECTSGYSTSWSAEWNGGNLGGDVVSFYASNQIRPVSTLNPFKSVAYQSHANCESACIQDAVSFYNVLPGYFCRCYTSQPSLRDPGAEAWEFCSIGSPVTNSPTNSPITNPPTDSPTQNPTGFPTLSSSPTVSFIIGHI